MPSLTLPLEADSQEMGNDARNDNEYYDYDRKIMRTSETKHIENIYNIVCKFKIIQS